MEAWRSDSVVEAWRSWCCGGTMVMARLRWWWCWVPMLGNGGYGVWVTMVVAGFRWVWVGFLEWV